MNSWNANTRKLACVCSMLAVMASAQMARAADADQAQNVQKVSAAVQVVNGEPLRNQALVNVAQIFQDSPSIQATTQPGGFSINLRGQGPDLPTGSAQGAAACGKAMTSAG